MATKLGAIQTNYIGLLDQLSGLTNPTLDTLLASINANETLPFRIMPASTPSLVITVQGKTVTNPVTGRNETIPPINNVAPTFTSGTITFPSASAGTITVSPGTNATLTVGTGLYINCGINLDASGNLNLTFGTAGSTAALATAAPTVANMYAIGYVTLQNISGVIQNVAGSAIYQYVGGGSGSGSGNANTLLETLKNQFVDSPYALLTTNIFSADAATKVASTTGTAAYSLVTSTMKFAAIADSFTSIAMLDSTEFLNDPNGLRDVGSVDLTAAWATGFVDAAATYAVSRDGGVHYDTLTMKRVGNGTETYQGSYLWNVEDQDSVTDVYSTVTLSQGIGSTSDFYSQPFFSAYPMTVTQVGLTLSRTGTPAGNYQIAIVGMSSAGVPVPTNPYWVSGYTAVTGLTTSAVSTTFSVPSLALPAGKYFIMLQTDATYKAAYSAGTQQLNVYTSTTSLPNPGYFFTTSWFSQNSTLDHTVTYTRDTLQTIADLTTLTAGGYQSLNATTQQSIAQPIILTSTQAIRAVNISVAASNVALTGNLYVQILADNGLTTEPSTATTAVLAQSNAIPVYTFSLAGSNQTTFDVAIPKTILAAGTYWIAISSDAAFKASCTALSAFVQIPTGNRSTFNPFQVYGGSSWGNGGTTTQALSVKVTGRPLDLRVKVTAGTASTQLAGYGVFYDLQNVGVVGATKKTQRFVFNSITDNLSSFTITGFVPDPDLLTCFWVEGGQVFKSPAFGLYGNVATFPANTFNQGGTTSQTITLIFDQNNGGASDSSDLNARLLATNHLGSPSGTDDKSASGRGVMLRDAGGTLRELTLDANDNVSILTGAGGAVLKTVGNGVSLLSASYTILNTDGLSTFFVTTGSSTITMTLPAASANIGRVLTFRKADTGTGVITINRAGSDTIDGATTTNIGTGGYGNNNNQYAWISLISNGTGWGVVGCGGEVLVTAWSLTSVTSGSYTNQGNIPVPSGNWSLYILAAAQSGTTGFFGGISTDSGATTFSDSVEGTNLIYGSTATNGVNDASFTVTLPVRLASATTYYAKVRSNTTLSATCSGRIIAVRQP